MLVAVTAGLAVQTWFKPGAAIAGGDVTAPYGLAWLGKLFEPWTWGGSNLGEPSQWPLYLPWAGVLGLVHAVGANADTAQRIWYSVLFIGAGLSALALLASLRLGPVAAVVGVAVYLLNPYVVTVVNTNDVYIAALCLLAAMPATMVATGTGRLSIRLGAVFLAVAAPLLGFVFLNPPLVGMILAATLATPLLAAWLDGKKAFVRTCRALALALPLLIAVSAYWSVPAFLHLSQIVPSQLASISDWAWTETRASLVNGLWLNTTWAWAYPEYFPYAAAYRLPLSAATFALPAIAFGAIALTLGGSQQSGQVWRNRQLRIAVVAATVAIFAIVLSTGTNPPGDIIFLRLYDLPFGWLLREPGRFLMLAGLGYSVLAAVTIEALMTRPDVANRLRWRRFTLPRLRQAVVPLTLVICMLIGFPIYTGAYVPDSKPVLPLHFVHARPTHIQMPNYWFEMARRADALPVAGGMIVMPPDDFYEMPYTWYYGSDSFVDRLFRRPVILPTLQGYTPASRTLYGAVNLVAQAILRQDWRQAEVLAMLMDTPLILVRGDVETPYLGRSIVPPAGLAASLNRAPNFTLVERVGPLELFALRTPGLALDFVPQFMTINSRVPDLRLLSLLPPKTGLASSEPQPGVGRIIQAPPLELWPAERGNRVWQTSLPAGWAYRLVETDSQTVTQLERPGTFPAANSEAKVVYAPNDAQRAVTVTLGERSAITNGDFANGLWGPVYDCDAVDPTGAAPHLNASVLTNAAPGGLPALRLSATLDSACEIQAVDWRGGPLLLSLMVHAVEGAAPRICVWEVGPERCATLPTIPEARGWFVYRASTNIDPGTTAVRLYLYGGGPGALGRTINEYANVRVTEVRALFSFALVGYPPVVPVSTRQLAVLHNSFSTAWQGPSSAQHVLVDGLLNGWLLGRGTRNFYASYKPADAFHAAGSVSIAGVVVLVVLVAWGWIGRLLKLWKIPWRLRQ